MEKIDESMQVHKEWYEQANKQTIETLPVFINHIMNDYSHDYGTICHAVAASAIAAAWAVNAHPNGGITGFQAGAVMWSFLRNWSFSNNKTGLRIIDYDNMLFPQYKERYDKTITPDVWSLIKNEAKSKIDEAKKDFDLYLQKLDEYNVAIEAFINKYPDYHERKAYYHRVSCGTWDQHQEDDRKEKAGFEFAPEEPYCPITDESHVYKHWESIVDGKVPFGYTVRKD
jgi:hypothetical protein